MKKVLILTLGLAMAMGATHTAVAQGDAGRGKVAKGKKGDWLDLFAQKTENLQRIKGILVVMKDAESVANAGPALKAEIAISKKLDKKAKKLGEPKSGAQARNLMLAVQTHNKAQVASIDGIRMELERLGGIEEAVELLEGKLGEGLHGAARSLMSCVLDEQAPPRPKA